MDHFVAHMEDRDTYARALQASGVGVRSTQKAQVYGQKASTRQDDKRAFFKLSYAAWEAIFEVNRMVTQELHC